MILLSSRQSVHLNTSCVCPIWCISHLLKHSDIAEDVLERRGGGGGGLKTALGCNSAVISRFGAGVGGNVRVESHHAHVLQTHTHTQTHKQTTTNKQYSDILYLINVSNAVWTIIALITMEHGYGMVFAHE